MKAKRHAIILEIIKERAIGTQGALTAALQKRQIRVTQATVSRDIKELRLVKVPTGTGGYRYAAPAEETHALAPRRMARIFRDSVLSIHDSENLIVLKTLPSTANAVAAILDDAGWEEVIGTVAGDDAILVVIKPKEAVPKILRKMRAMLAV